MLGQSISLRSVMSNSNYVAGRAFEYETMRTWEARGYMAIRASGSHGAYDIIAFRPDRKPEMVQCKRTSDLATANRLLLSFKADTVPSRHYHQTMSVKIKGTREPIEVVV